MEPRVTFSLLFVCIAVQCAVGFPRESGIIQKNEIPHLEIESVFEPKENFALNEKHQNVIKIPGRVSCQYEEASEDIVCQEHCLPKGYSYGLCVGRQCSCI